MPVYLYFIVSLLLVAVLLPFSSVLAHFIACFVGCAYFYGYLEKLMLNDRALNFLEGAGFLLWYVEKESFIPRPGDLQLPVPGAYIDPSM